IGASQLLTVTSRINPLPPLSTFSRICGITRIPLLLSAAYVYHSVNRNVHLGQGSDTIVWMTSVVCMVSKDDDGMLSCEVRIPGHSGYAVISTFYYHIISCYDGDI